MHAALAEDPMLSQPRAAPSDKRILGIRCGRPYVSLRPRARFPLVSRVTVRMMSISSDSSVSHPCSDSCSIFEACSGNEVVVSPSVQMLGRRAGCSHCGSLAVQMVRGSVRWQRLAYTSHAPQRVGILPPIDIIVAGEVLVAADILDPVFHATLSAWLSSGAVRLWPISAPPAPRSL